MEENIYVNADTLECIEVDRKKFCEVLLTMSNGLVVRIHIPTLQLIIAKFEE